MEESQLLPGARPVPHMSWAYRPAGGRRSRTFLLCLAQDDFVGFVPASCVGEVLAGGGAVGEFELAGEVALVGEASVGGGIRLVDRTNNCLEGLFDDIKHGERRRSGRKILTQDLEQLPPAAALATNLRASDYVAIVCGTLDQLPHAFAQLDAASRRRSALVARDAARPADATDCDVVSASLPRADRVLIRTEHMDQRIRAAAGSRAPRH